MRIALLTTLFFALAAPAMATDSGDAAFELLSAFEAEKKRPNYIKLQSSIGMADAETIDAKISEIYGAPTVSREGLKVWEVENTTGSGAKHTTIMCGPDGHGGIFISADRRGPKANGANSRAKAKQVKKIIKQPSLPKKSRYRSHERD